MSRFIPALAVALSLSTALQAQARWPTIVNELRQVEERIFAAVQVHDFDAIPREVAPLTQIQRRIAAMPQVPAETGGRMACGHAAASLANVARHFRDPLNSSEAALLRDSRAWVERMNECESAFGTRRSRLVVP